MDIERDYRRMTYVISIPREEIKRFFTEALKEVDGKQIPISIDEIVADKMSKKIVTLINSDLRGNNG